MSFAENLKKLPGISHLAVINLLDAEGKVVAAIENKAGSQGSLAVYNHLARQHCASNTFSPSRSSLSAPLGSPPISALGKIRKWS